MAFWDGSQWVPESMPRRSGAREVAGHALAALAEASMVAALVGGLVAGTAFAKGGGTSATPWIALASVDGANTVTTQPFLGASVKFASGYPTNTKNPWVSLTCSQSGVVVFGQGGHPWDTFSLGGASSQWLVNGGGATCTAELGDLYWKGGHEYYTYLATTSFSAGG